MKRKGTQSDRAKFTAVLDQRNRRIRGLWVRNGHFYAQVRVPGLPHPCKIKIQADTVPQAVAGLQAILVKRRNNQLEVSRRAGVPTLTMAIDAYLLEREALKDKRPATIKREKSSLKHWKKFAGDTLVNKVTDKLLFDFAAWFRGEKPTVGRAVDVAIVCLRNVLKKSLREGHFKVIPIGKWKAIAPKPRLVRLITTEEADKLIEAAKKLVQGKQFVDYLRLLQYSGAREMEALRLTWQDVNFERKELTIGFDGLSKNGRARVVPMSPKLEAHLLDMFKRYNEREGEKKPSDLLFPKKRHGKKGGKVITSYKASLRHIKKMTGSTDVGFHHYRHYFISHAVMAGIDYMTISIWVGHRDGGGMIGKIYGHINSEHSQKQAAKLSF